MAEKLQEKIVEQAPGIIDITNEYFTSLLHSMWPKLQEMPFLKFILFILFGYIVAKLIQFVLIVFTYFISRKTKNQLDDHLISILKKPTFLIILVLFLIIAIRGLEIEASLRSATEKVLLTFLVLNLMTNGFKILHLLLNALGALSDKYQMIQAKTVPLFELVGKISLFAIVSYVILLIWGINPTAWLASAGVIGIAVGFAAKDTLSNLFSGFFIIVDAPYKVGDYIVLDTGDRGMVTHVDRKSVV